MQISQYKPIRLGKVSFVAGGSYTLKLDKLKPRLDNAGISHLRAIQFSCKATPTITGGGSESAVTLNKAIKSLIITDGTSRKHFDGSFASLRAYEAYENGRLPYPEPDAAATGEQVNFVRAWDAALATFLKPHDFVLPAACWQDGTIEFGFAALADLDANLTALTLDVEVIAWVFAQQDLIIGAQLERKEINVTSDVAVNQEALIPFFAVANSKDFDVFTAGDIGNMSISDEVSTAPEKIDRRVFEDGYHRDFKVGDFSQIHGDLRAATDDNPKVRNGTALASAPSYLQPVIWSQPGSRLSKVVYSARPGIILSVDGAQATFWGLFSRVLRRTVNDYAKYLAACRDKLGITPDDWTPKTPTLSKDGYVGSRAAFFPQKLKRPSSASTKQG